MYASILTSTTPDDKKKKPMTANQKLLFFSRIAKNGIPKTLSARLYV
jgi:hypothetical protein